MYKLIFSRQAQSDYQFFLQTDKKIVQRINSLIQNIEISPYEGIGKPEPLRHELTGFWSRRINREHRLIYRIINDELQVLSCRFHYK